ncbi:MAG: hypothetical protein KDI53_05290 [Candidatus Accumulibacter sp.]|nr:hypothetical protein [Accumulibacter sp.]
MDITDAAAMKEGDSSDESCERREGGKLSAFHAFSPDGKKQRKTREIADSDSDSEFRISEFVQRATSICSGASPVKRGQDDHKLPMACQLLLLNDRTSKIRGGKRCFRFGNRQAR